MELQLSDLILENPQQMIALISKEGVFLYVNDMFCSVCGYQAEELLGENRRILASGYHDQAFFDDLWKASDSGYIWKGEIKNKRKDGSFFWMDTTIIPLFSGSGELAKSLSISVDITEKKEKEEKQQLQEWIIESIDDAILSKDLSGKITGCNPGAERLFGYSQQELLGKRISILIPPELLMEEAQLVADIRSGKKVENYETERITKGGKRIQVTISLSPIKDMAGRLIGISKLVHDITLRKREEKILAEAAEKYRNYFAKSPLPMFVVEIPGYRYLDVNQAAIDNYGYSREEFLSMSAADIRTEKEKERFQSESPEIDPHKTFNRGIWEHIKKDGTRIRVGVNASDIDFEGKKARLIMSLDITSQKEAEDKLQRSEARYRHTLDTMMEGVQIIGFDGTIIYVNDKLASQAKFTKEQMIGKTLPELYPGVEQSPIYQSYQQCLKDRQPIHLENKFEFPDQSVQTFEISVQPVPEGIFVLSADVTAKREVDEKVRLLNEATAKSEKRFRGVIESSHDIVLLMDASLATFYRSPSARRAVGLVGDNSAEYRLSRVHPDDVPSYNRSFERVQKEKGIPIPISFRFRHYDGHYIWHEGFLTNLLDDDAVKAIVANLQDITQRKISEQLLEKSERVYRTIASNIPGSAICLLDENLVYTLLEGDMLEKFGYHKTDLLGKKVVDIVTPDREERILGIFKRALAGEQVRIEDSMAGCDTMSSYIPLKDDRNRVYGVMVIIIDVTELKKAQKELKKLNLSLEHIIEERTAQLISANRELEAFSYSVSHDLRAPLRGIDGWSLALQEDYGTQLDEKANQYIARVRSETQRMGDLIDDLLKLSRISRTELKPARINLSDIIKTISERLLEENPGRNIHFTIAPGLMVKADAKLLEIACTNLMSNACKFTSRKEMAEISFGQTKYEGKPVFFIKDNGAGFDMATAKKLFGAFQRMHRQSEFPGTGIGLAIVKRIISLHQGDVWAEAELGKGATFYFTIKDTL